MRILYLVAYTPNRIRTRPHHFIKALVARGHEVTVATLWENEGEREYLQSLRGEGVEVLAFPLSKLRILWNVARGSISREPVQANYSWHPALMRAVLARTAGDKRPEVIQAEHIRGAQYALRLQQHFARRKEAPLLVWDSVDCISHLYEQAARFSRSLRGRLMTGFELRRTKRYERILLDKIEQVLVTSANDKEAYQRLTGGEASNVSVVANGVDLEYFSPSGEAREANTLVFSGKMNFHANVTAALYLVKEIMPRVWAHNPDVRVWLVGKDPPGLVRDLGKDNPKVEVTGMVADMRPYLRRASLSVAPVTYGAGIQNKVLEAMACGTPVVASPQAVSALEAREGQDVVVAENAPKFAEAILSLLADGAARRALGDDGRKYVSLHHDWGKMVLWLEAAYTMAREYHEPP